ncbi:hypothetical protein HYALB_00013971 [Hymenoscyphus albidus]|uniref:Reverse transcriptase domain-containing protein n=1 Tax=Hymenoscyphus albidus TaxID=595503 RepID=A0A9N9LZT6_9HELO|nr:hypothetical protein HYALB_00013971 [Hymenoscyphus albidus]
MLNLANHELILGLKWFEYFNISISPRTRTLIWPLDYDPAPSYERLVRWKRSDLYPKRIDKADQLNADKRDAAQDANFKRREDGKLSTLRRPPPIHVEGAEISIVTVEPAHHKELARQKSLPRKFSTELKENLKKMQDELDNKSKSKPLQPRQPKPLWTPSKEPSKRLVDIQMISANSFYWNCNHRENTLFSITLAELDKQIDILQQRQDSSDKSEESTHEALLRVLPPEWHDRIKAFSRGESDTLADFKPSDHNIELEEGHSVNELRQSPLCKQSLAELEAIREYLRENLAKGFIAPSNAPYASPVLFDRYPLPLIEETLARLAKAKIFTKLDIRQAFHRIRVAATSEDLTTFRPRYGAFKCKVLPFGLANGPATFQRYMNSALAEYLDIFCTAYLDDILIYSEDPLEHEEHVRKVLKKLEEHGLHADIKKCEFKVKKTKFLGFIIGTDGIQVDPAKINTITQWQRPKTVKASTLPKSTPLLSGSGQRRSKQLSLFLDFATSTGDSYETTV